MIEVLLNKIFLGDCRELIETIPDESIDLIFTDPPYTKDTLWTYGWLAEQAKRVLKPSGFCMCYSGTLWLDYVMAHMLEHLDYFMFAMTYEPGCNSKLFHRRVVQMSKPMLIFNKPPMHHAYHQMINVFRTNTQKQYHKWGQDVSCARYYIHCLSQPGDTILEPFAGGGTTCLAAMQEGRNFIAFELDPQAYLKAQERITLWQPKLMDSFDQLEMELFNG